MKKGVEVTSACEANRSQVKPAYSRTVALQKGSFLRDLHIPSLGLTKEAL